MGFDTKVGMIFSNLMTFFIILTTAATLHANGITDIETPQQAALALRPLAGNFAYILFAVGIIGIGWQSIPVLAGSIGYALSEAIGAKEGLSKKFNKAKIFLCNNCSGYHNWFGNEFGANKYHESTLLCSGG